MIRYYFLETQININESEVLTVIEAEQSATIISSGVPEEFHDKSGKKLSIAA